VFYWRGAEKRTSRLSLLPSDDDVTEGLITWPRRAEESCAACLGVLGGILGASRHRSFGSQEEEVVLDVVVVPAIRLWVKEMHPRHARRSFSTSRWRIEKRSVLQRQFPSLPLEVGCTLLVSNIVIDPLNFLQYQTHSA
jgi:hypothetical protein